MLNFKSFMFEQYTMCLKDSFFMSGILLKIKIIFFTVTSSSHYDRAATPDSISSIGSSASNQIKAQQNSYQVTLSFKSSDPLTLEKFVTKTRFT